MGVYGSNLMSGIDLPTQNHQNKCKSSLKWKMLNGVIFPLRFSDFLCILKTMVRFVNFRLLLPILFLLTSYGPYTAPICLHLHISEKSFFWNTLVNMHISESRQFKLRSFTTRPAKMNFPSDKQYKADLLWSCWHCSNIDSQTYIQVCPAYQQFGDARTLTIRVG